MFDQTRRAAIEGPFGRAGTRLPIAPATSPVINGARLLCYREIASRLSPRPTTDNNEAVRDYVYSQARTLPERQREREREREREKERERDTVAGHFCASSVFTEATCLCENKGRAAAESS